MKNDEIQKLIDVNDSNKKALDFSRRGAVMVNKAMADQDPVLAAKTYLSIYDNGMIVPNPDVMQGAAYYVIKSLLKSVTPENKDAFYERLLLAIEVFCIAKHSTYNEDITLTVRDIVHLIKRTKDNLEAATMAENVLS